MTKSFCGPLGWTKKEQHWAHELFIAALPGSKNYPGIDKVDLTQFWSQFNKAGPPTLKLGFRASIWVLNFAAPMHIGQWNMFCNLSESEKNLALERCAKSKSGMVRQMVEIIKIIVCMAYFQDQEVQKQFRGEF